MTPSSRRKLGLTFMILPPVCIVAAPILFAIFNFVFSTLAVASMSQGGGGGGAMVAARIVNVLLGFVGIVGLAGLFTLLPIGLYLFFSTPKTTVPPQVPPTPPQA